MNYKNVNINNIKYKRISLQKVKNILNNPSKYAGLVLYFLPINANPKSPWFNGFDCLEIEKDLSIMDTVDYYNYLKEYTYYNCLEGLGSYLKYYLKVN